MSVNIWCDIGQEVSSTLCYYVPEFNAFAKLCGRRTSRWGGLNRGYNYVTEFRIKLPDQVELAWQLTTLCSVLEEEFNQPRIGSNPNGSSPNAKSCRKSMGLLKAKLTASLGLPSTPVSGDEAAFIAQLNDNPGDLGTWGVYRDWLMERGDPRAEVIVGWMHPKKKMKIKYGLPEIVRDEYKKVTPGNNLAKTLHLA